MGSCSHPCELLFLNDLSNELFHCIHRFPLVTSDGVKKFLCCLATVTVNHHHHHCLASLNFKAQGLLSGFLQFLAKPSFEYLLILSAHQSVPGCLPICCRWFPILHWRLDYFHWPQFLWGLSCQVPVLFILFIFLTFLLVIIIIIIIIVSLNLMIYYFSDWNVKLFLFSL